MSVTQEYSVLRIAATSHSHANTCIASVYFLRTYCRVFKPARCDAAAHKRFSPTSNLNAEFPALFHPRASRSRVRLVCYVQSPRAARKACARACVSHLVFYTGIVLGRRHLRGIKQTPANTYLRTASVVRREPGHLTNHEENLAYTKKAKNIKKMNTSCEIRKSKKPNCGDGLFATEFIPAYTIIGEYTGPVVAVWTCVTCTVNGTGQRL